MNNLNSRLIATLLWVLSIPTIAFSQGYFQMSGGLNRGQIHNKFFEGYHANGAHHFYSYVNRISHRYQYNVQLGIFGIGYNNLTGYLQVDDQGSLSWKKLTFDMVISYSFLEEHFNYFLTDRLMLGIGLNQLITDKPGFGIDEIHNYNLDNIVLSENDLSVTQPNTTKDDYFQPVNIKVFQLAICPSVNFYASDIIMFYAQYNYTLGNIFAM